MREVDNNSVYGRGSSMNNSRDEEFAPLFEQKVQALYRQRKQQLQPPEIKLAAHSGAGRKYLAWMRPLVLLFGGGVVSFGLMALISHFAGHQQQSLLQAEPESNIIRLASEPEPEEKQAVIKVTPPLPPKAVSQPPKASEAPAVERHRQPDNGGEFSWQVNIAQQAALPELEQPGVALTPSYKVMPEYSVKARKKGQQGAVKLGYKINPAGWVTDIEVIDASVGRELQRLSRQALSQWRYQAGIAGGQQHQVVFEFSLNDG